MNVVFFGTPAFAAETLSYLLDQGIHITAVVTRTDKPKGRTGHPLPTPVKEVALKRGLPVYQPEKASDPAFMETLESFNADLFVVVAYGEILKQRVLDAPRKGCINLHASLLPKYRGAAPIQRCIMEGETKSGVSIMYMVKKMDAGDVIETAEVPITPEMTFGELEAELCRVGAPLLASVIRRFETGPVPGIPQDESQVTFAAKIELEDCQIDWTKPAAEIHNLIRGVNPYPGAWSLVTINGEKKRIKIFSSQIATPELKNKLVISCGSGSLAILELQLEGKKRAAADAFLCGTPRNQIIF